MDQLQRLTTVVVAVIGIQMPTVLQTRRQGNWKPRNQKTGQLQKFTTIVVGVFIIAIMTMVMIAAMTKFRLQPRQQHG